MLLKTLVISVTSFIMALAPLAMTGSYASAKEKVEKTPASYAVVLKNTKGDVVGQALLSQSEGGVVVQLTVQGLKPGLHGIHFHEKGVCQPADFVSAGDHFNPYGKKHGLQNPKGPHAGDLENLFADQNGHAQTSFITSRVTLEKGKKNSLRDEDGSALIIHADEDDQMTDPSGNSGARIVCGEIK
ncbi:superoxide dismutase family protein [Tuberibacillus calidus]|jgi:Cu-Zn family superoxide dismutase|uniref:superoxide dismutase family protein n=1 Tax=Tuberibacillus calidus TaxID=340097 RepID=UPI00047F3AD9